MNFEQLKPNTFLFSDAGMIPGGGSWLTPTDAFMELWKQKGEQLTKKGFRSDMQERLPVTVARYQLESICALPKLPYHQVCNFSLAERYTL